MVRGCTGSVTSASTVLLEPRIVRRASCAAGPPEQLACRLAQDGTAMGLAAWLGAGDGLGASDGLGDGLSDAGARPRGGRLLRSATHPRGGPPPAGRPRTPCPRLVPPGHECVPSHAR